MATCLLEALTLGLFVTDPMEMTIRIVPPQPVARRGAGHSRGGARSGGRGSTGGGGAAPRGSRRGRV